MLFFSSAQYNQIIWGMMKQWEGQNIEKQKFKLDLKFCKSRGDRDDDEKFYWRPTFYISNLFYTPKKIFDTLNLAWGYLAL